MSAKILSYFRQASGLKGDWSHQELAEFYRVEAATLQAGVRIVTDRGVSDEGEPWFVFCRSLNESVFLHFARIDGLYCIASEGMDDVMQGPDFRALLTELVRRHPTFLPIPQQGPNAKVLLHPAVLLTAIVVTACLLTSPTEALANAQAQGNSGSDTGSDADSRIPTGTVNAPSKEGSSKDGQAAHEVAERQAVILGVVYLAASLALAMSDGGENSGRGLFENSAFESLSSGIFQQQAKTRAVIEEAAAAHDLAFRVARSASQDGAVGLLGVTSDTNAWLLTSTLTGFVGSSVSNSALGPTIMTGPLLIGLTGQAPLGYTASLTPMTTARLSPTFLHVERGALLATDASASKSESGAVAGVTHPNDSPAKSSSDTGDAAEATSHHGVAPLSSAKTGEQTISNRTVVASYVTSDAAVPGATQKAQFVKPSHVGSGPSDTILNSLDNGAPEASRTPLALDAPAPDAIQTAQIIKPSHVGPGPSETLSKFLVEGPHETAKVKVAPEVESNSLVGVTPPAAEPAAKQISNELATINQTNLRKEPGLMLTDSSEINLDLVILRTNTSFVPALHLALPTHGNTTVPHSDKVFENGSLMAASPNLELNLVPIVTPATSEMSSDILPVLGQPAASVTPSVALAGSGPTAAVVPKLDPNVRILDLVQTRLIDTYIAHTPHLGATFVGNTLLLFDTVPVIGSSAQVTTWDLGDGSRLEIVGLSNVVHG